jgi:hypothetical protein
MANDIAIPFVGGCACDALHQARRRVDFLLYWCA